MAADWIAAGALLVSLYAVLRGEQRASKAKKREASERGVIRARGPSDEIRNAVVSFRKFFTSVVSTGRVSRDRFYEQKEAGQNLRDLAGRVEDPDLRTAMEEISNAWDYAFASAPPKRGKVLNLNQAPSPGDRAEQAADVKRSDRQVQHAEIALESCKVALERLNALEK